MSKMKSKRGAAKRFVSRSGSTARQAFKRHILTKKTTKQTSAAHITAVHAADVAAVKAMLPYA